MTDPLTPDTTPEVAVAAAAAEPEPITAAPEQAPEPLAAAPAPVLELELPAPVLNPVSVAEPAPLAVAEPEAASTAAPSSEVFGLPLKLLNVLLARIGATPLHAVGDLVPVLRILTLAVVAGIALKLTSATLGAIDDLPLVGGLLELVGLVTLLNFLARNAFKQQKRAELLARIQQLKTDLLG